MLGEDLMKAYPDAKIILTHRDPESWYISMQHSIFNWGRPSSILRFLSYFHGPDGLIGTMFLWLPICLNIYVGHDWDDEETVKQRYLQQYDVIRNSILEEGRLLEFEQPFEWDTLCAFQGVDVPKGIEYPRANTKDDMKAIYAMVVKTEVKKIGGGLCWAFGTGLVIWAAFRLRSRL